MNLTLPGLKKILLAPRPHGDGVDVAATRARALFEPPGTAGARGGNLVEFLARVSLFEDLGRVRPCQEVNGGLQSLVVRVWALAVAWLGGKDGCQQAARLKGQHVVQSKCL